jgi:hypothetical protein
LKGNILEKIVSEKVIEEKFKYWYEHRESPVANTVYKKLLVSA